MVVQINISFQVVIVPGNIEYKGPRNVVEFVVNNWTIVDAGGKRDTKKVCLRSWAS
jgi:hypothetical protein